MKQTKNILLWFIIALNIVGVICLIYFAIPYFTHNVTVTNPDAMLPMEAWDIAGMALTIGFVPLLIANLLCNCKSEAEVCEFFVLYSEHCMLYYRVKLLDTGFCFCNIRILDLFHFLFNIMSCCFFFLCIVFVVQIQCNSCDRCKDRQY